MTKLGKVSEQTKSGGKVAPVGEPLNKLTRQI